MTWVETSRRRSRSSDRDLGGFVVTPNSVPWSSTSRARAVQHIAPACIRYVAIVSPSLQLFLIFRPEAIAFMPGSAVLFGR